MTTTYFGCSHSDVWASPSNWQTTTAKTALQKNWYVQCYFFDPKYEKEYPDGFSFRRKANRPKTLDGRRALVKLIKDEMLAALEQGYNPITGTFMPIPILQEKNIVPVYNKDTPLCTALKLAIDLSEYTKVPLQDVKSIVGYFEAAAAKLHYNDMPVGDVIGIHIKQILDNVIVYRVVKGGKLMPFELTDKRYNRYLAYLSSLFTTLKKNGMVIINPCEGVTRKDTVVDPRTILTIQERIKIASFLQINFPRFYLFVEIFFHSGGREIELLQVKYEHVDLVNFTYKAIVHKGGKSEWKTRPIKKVAVPFWEMAMRGAVKGQYLMSTGLVPGDKPIRRDQITRRWKEHVKKKLNIKADIYSLKHSNLTEISERTNAKTAAKAAAHSSDKMIRMHYDITANEREMNAVKNMTNTLAPIIKRKNQKYCSKVACGFFSQLEAVI
jgi:integrase